MKLPNDAIIAPEKITRYLLVRKKHRDKSKWLAQAGYTLGNWRKLEEDIRKEILPLEALPTENTKYGQMYEILANLTGPNGKVLAVCTIWMIEKTGVTKFITLFPNKR